MSTKDKFGRQWSRRKVLGTAAAVGLVVVSLLTAGAASGRWAAHHNSSHRVATTGAKSSTHSLSNAHRNASLVSRSFSRLGSSSLPQASITGCGADGTIADASGFEDADGNLAIDKAGCMDWNGFTPTWSGTAPFQTGTASNNGWTFVGATDAFNSTSDSIYAGGVKQDTVCPGTVTGKANDKADLAAMYVATKRIGDQTYLALAWERQLDTTTQSDVFVSFEFNQGNVSCGSGSPFVQRTVGDLLIQYNFQSGISTIDVQQWDGTTWQPLPTPPYEAAVNTGTVTDTIRPDGPVNLTTYEFGEAGLDLSALNLTGNGGKACETFGSVFGSSRTSKSGDTAQLKDYVGPAPFDASTCVKPTATTTLKNAADDSTISDGSSVSYGSSIYDTATLGNLVEGQIPTGQVQYTFFSNGTCSGTGADAGLKTLNADGSVPHSNTQGPLAAGSYSFNAKYLSGADAHYSDSDVSACEPFTVLKQSPSVSTLLSESTGNVGDSVHDSATLNGATANAGGTITYKVYSDNECSQLVADLTPANNNVVNGIAPDSLSHVFNSAGTFYFQATYSGDTNNNGPVSSECTSEQLVINGADIKIVKTPDAAQVNAGEPIGFTLTVYNGGNGDAHGVKLTDPLPVKAGLDWSIAGQGAGWGDSCSIDAGVLTCGGSGGVTVGANTTQGASTFTVHITSPTTADTGGVCPGGSGVINNTGDVTTSNDGSGESSASTCVAAPAIQIVKTADAAQVNAGSPIGFTLTVYNTGSGDAHGVKLSDTLPTNAGLSWSIDQTGTGWASSCSIVAGVLSCGGANGVTVPAGTTQAASTFTVHITSPTTGATGGQCPETGVVNNTGTVTTGNDGSGQSSASTCVQAQAVVDLSITKSGSPDRQTGLGNITWTMVVTNNGPSTDTGVKVSDPMPAGNTFVSATSTQGTCTGGAILNCDIGTMAAGASVTITLVTTPSAYGTQTNTAVVSGDTPESNLANNTASASVVTVGPATPPCVKISKLTPGHLIVGRKTTVTIKLTQGGSAAKGVKVRIKGAGVNLLTKPSNAHGVTTQTLTMRKKGILTFVPVVSAGGASCGTSRIGVRGVFTPPVTG